MWLFQYWITHFPTSHDAYQGWKLVCSHVNEKKIYFEVSNCFDQILFPAYTVRGRIIKLMSVKNIYFQAKWETLRKQGSILAVFVTDLETLQSFMRHRKRSYDYLSLAADFYGLAPHDWQVSQGSKLKWLFDIIWK